MQSKKFAIHLVLFFLFVCSPCIAQRATGDTSAIRHLNPKKAAILSAVLPGLGQIYNGKIWKSAIVYAGFGGITYAFIYNQGQYRSYQQAVNARYDTLASTVDMEYAALNDGMVRSLRDYHRRNRDICILSYIGLYALNIIDANVDAHLQEFKINKDLTLRWQPLINPTSGGMRTGLNLALTF